VICIDKVIAEIYLSVLIVVLLMTGIQIARDQMDIVSIAAERVNETDKIKEEILLPLKKNQVKGADVISVIRFYKNNSVTINVTLLGGDSKSYVAENYDNTIFEIPYTGIFQATYTRDVNGNLTRVSYVEQ
jgi:hypothetical protein